MIGHKFVLRAFDGEVWGVLALLMIFGCARLARLIILEINPFNYFVGLHPNRIQPCTKRRKYLYEVCKLDDRENATARLGPVWYFAIHLSRIAPSFVAAERDLPKAGRRMSKGAPDFFYENVIDPFTFLGRVD